jgi:hypothetical protein
MTVYPERFLRRGAQPTSPTRSPRPYSDFSGPSRHISFAVPSSYSLFVLAKKVNSFAINKIQPLFAKPRGWGIPNATTGHPEWWWLLSQMQTASLPRRSLCLSGKSRSLERRNCTILVQINTFRMNTCEKRGGGGRIPSRSVPAPAPSPVGVEDPILPVTSVRRGFALHLRHFST